MNGINKAIIVGYVGQDPKIQSFSNGGKAANFTVATTERGYTTKSGRQVAEQTEWHNVVCYGSLAGVVEQYIHKGTPVYVEGKLHTRSYEDQSGKHYVTEINCDTMQMLGSRQDQMQRQQQPQPAQPAPQPQTQQSAQPPFDPANDSTDDLPF